MLSLEDIIRLLRKNKDFFRKKYFVSRFAIFGSYVRGEQKPESDIDIIAEFEKSPGLEFVDLAEDLEKLLGTSVDLVSKKAINERFMKHIRQELKYV